MILYDLAHIKQHYTARTVLDIAHLQLEAERIYALIGANGAGKTTLLNILSFLEKPVQGTIHFRETAVDYSSRPLIVQLRRQVVLVDQHPIMFSASVGANIEYGLKLRKIDKRVRHNIINEVLEKVGLSRYDKAQAHELSGGETQRLALARALALGPDVLLCDEPTASVDTENQARIRSLLQRINQEEKTTIIFTTHDRLQAAALAQHTLVLEGGRLAPTTYDNIFSCTILNHDRHLHCLLENSLQFCLEKDALGEIHSPDGSRRIFIDPERISLNTVNASLRGELILTMAEGEKVRLVVSAGIPLTILMTKEQYRQQRPTVGETVQFAIPAEALTFLA